RTHYNTVRPHSSLGYRPPAPEAIQPCPPDSVIPRLTDMAEGNESMSL
ncbi:MAG TPA: integrase core domain-containing protein, partial [Armatimonadota bacterium]|nr:integrase core domain-containing protein [Armatimonadota bacterium]